MTVARKQRSGKKKKEKPGDRLKYEIARELGLGEKVDEKGWGGLTAAETGRIGGIITTRKRVQKLKERQKSSAEG
ncbi:MAG: small, acid-soluble spore protein, alpha/beta type [Firmicutes bacterium]|nr:small, acid-soluble spore protein, alpha/beta type [Bacillota bacterium]MDD3298479.1 small, acid-soluble spore protein, alpha/beta type [Bacillota bacterium]MDD3851249.1 small, acid-soluble spore protein, alpha/beta type [Bacillota bacterium]MDD4707078.1 small, acid-soluble spore protein, alpha/beta type [Bacillota bacterium]